MLPLIPFVLSYSPSPQLSGDVGTEMEQEHTPVSPGDIGGSAEVAQEHTQALSSSAGMASSPVASTEPAKDEVSKCKRHHV